MANGQLLGFIDSGQDLNGQLRNNGDEIIGEVSASGQVLGALIGQSGRPGVGIASIVKTGTSGLIDTYTITYTNNTTSTFEVTNGQQGNPGATGNGISNIAKTSSAGLVDTYTITYTNGDTDTFTVTNGAGGAWGSITGTLADQTDLKSALDDKISKSLTSGLVKNDGTIDTTTYSTFSGAYGDLTGTPTIPENTSDLVNDSGFIDNSVNNLVNYFKKADDTLPIYFVNASEHNTSGTAFNFAEKPVGLYLFLPNSTTPFDLYIKPRTGATTTSILSALVFAVHIKNVLPSVYVSNQTNYACSVLSDGKYRTYELVDENNDFDLTWVTTTFLTTGENNTITGQLTFSTLPKSSVTPTDNDHFTRKKYVDDLLSAFKDAAYPIGKTELFYDNLDHSNYLGFTWVLDFKGQVPVGIDTNDTDFDTIGKTGGEKEHTLIENEMPKHKHRSPIEFGGDQSLDNYSGYGYNNTSRYYVLSSAAGGDQPHNNVQPFKVVAIWRRTA